MIKLDIHASEVIDLDKNPEFRLKRRTFGIDMPGYVSGWFRLQNGQKPLLYLTTHDNVVYIQIHEDYSILLSLDEPEIILDSLKNY